MAAVKSSLADRGGSPDGGKKGAELSLSADGRGD